MKALTFGMTACAVVAAGVVLVAQDPVKTNPEVYKVVVENAAVRVLSVSVAAGAKTAMHQHPDSMIVTLTGGKVRFSTPDGKSQDVDMANDTAQYAPAETHQGANLTKGALSVVVVEFKGAAPGKAVLPTSRPGLTLTTLAEGPRATAYKSTTAPTFAEPAGTTHDFDQVVIALGPGQMSLSIDGKPAKTTWARGDVVFIGRGVKHEAKNAGGKPADVVIVAIK